MEICFRNIEGMWFGVAHEGKSIFATAFGSDENKVRLSLSESLESDAPFHVVCASSTFAAKIFATIKTVYDGKTTSGIILFDMKRLSNYTQRVLQTVFQIPVGYVSSYAAVAEVAGGGARAVGNVMASNPFAPLIPCHRVVTSGLGLGGYGGGAQTKLELLQREKRGLTNLDKVLVNGGLLRVFPVEFVLGKVEKSNSKKNVRT